MMRSPSSRLSTRLRTSRDPSWASAQWSVAPSPMIGVAVLERDGRRGQFLEAGELEPRVAGRGGPRASRRGTTGRRRAGPGPDATSSSSDGRARALAERDERAREERPVGLAGVPADDDRAGEADAGRDVEDDALAPQRAGQLGEPVVGRQDRAAVEQLADAVRVASGEVGDRRQRRRRRRSPRPTGRRRSGRPPR